MERKGRGSQWFADFHTSETGPDPCPTTLRLGLDQCSYKLEQLSLSTPAELQGKAGLIVTHRKNDFDNDDDDEDEDEDEDDDDDDDDDDDQDDQDDDHDGDHDGDDHDDGGGRGDDNDDVE